MSDYIKRDKALNASKIVYVEYIELDGDGYEEANADNIPIVLKKDIEAIPAADVRPVVRSSWEFLGNGDGICLQCGRLQRRIWDIDGWQNFCGHCGADMR